MMFRGTEREQLRAFGSFAHAPSHRAKGTSWYGAHREAAWTVEVHYDPETTHAPGGSLLTAKHVLPQSSPKEAFLDYVGQHVVNERLRTLSDRTLANIEKTISLANNERQQLAERVLEPSAMNVDSTIWPGIELQIEDVVYLWASLPSTDIYATGDRSFVSTEIRLVTLAG